MTTTDETTTAVAKQPPKGLLWSLAMDGIYANLATGAGGESDAFRSMVMRTEPAPEWTQPQIDELVRLEWGCAKHVRHRPQEATRKGFDLALNGESVSPSLTRDVLSLLETVPVFSDECGRGYLTAICQAAVLERLYGGALLIAWTDDRKDAAEPLDLDSGGADWSLLRLEVRDRYRVDEPALEDIDREPNSPNFGQPKVWRLHAEDLQPGGSHILVHHSRVFRFPGASMGRRRSRPWQWGVTSLESFEPAWRTYRHTFNEALSVVARLGETRIGIKDLFELLASGDDRAIEGLREAVGEMARVRSALRVFMHDADHEVQDANIPMQGAIAMIERAREHVAAAAGMSAQAFFGLQQQGLSNNDESGERRDDAVTAELQRRLLEPLDWLTRIALRSLGAQGVDDWAWTPRPLREETAQERSSRHSSAATAAQTYLTEGVVHPMEVRAGLKAAGDAPYVFDERYDADLEIEAEAAHERTMAAPIPPGDGGGAPPPPGEDDPKDPAGADPADG